MKKKDHDLLLLKLSNIEKMLVDNSKDNDEIMSFNQICNYLDISKSYLYKLTMSGKIPHYKPLGKRLYFSKKEVNTWIKENIPTGGDDNE